MKYLSIDIETLGLKAKKHSLIEFTCILEDTDNIKSFEDIPKFQTYIINEEYQGDPFAMNMNKDIIEKIANYPNSAKEHSFTHYNDLALKFYQWLGAVKYEQPELILAGKNLAMMDLKFLKRVPNFKKYFKVNHKILDPGVLYVDWQNDEEVPGMTLCNQRAGVVNEKLHSALFDSWNTIQLLRIQYVK